MGRPQAAPSLLTKRCERKHRILSCHQKPLAMKSIFTFLFVVFCTTSLLAQRRSWDVNVGYALMLPQGNMKQGWNNAHGITLSGLYAFRDLPFLRVGANLQYGIYGYQRQQQEYRFPNSNTTITQVQLSSSIATLGGRVQVLYPKYLPVRPYVDIQSGMFGMFSSLYIEDPRDPFGCRALEQRDITSDVTWYTAAGGGVLIDMDKRTKDKHMLDIAFHYGFGGGITYANMGDLKSEHAVGNGHTGTNGAKPYTARFVNVTTNEVHEHQVAELFDHQLRYLQLAVTYRFRF